MRNIRLLALLIFVFFLLLGYAWQIEPNLLRVQRLVVNDPTLNHAWSGLTIVHLSDLHITQEGAKEARLLAKIQEISPDLIVMSGDFRQWAQNPRPAQNFMAKLSAPLGVYGVLGDADQVQGSDDCGYCHPGGRYAERLTRPVIMQNELRQIDWRGKTVVVAGVDADETGMEWLKKLQSKMAEDDNPLMILSHQSRPWSEYPFAVHSLWLSGDTHGGQIRMPDWFWRMIHYKPDTAHMGGLYGNGRGGWLLVNRGIGQTARFPFRLGVPPEIVVITFGEQ
ncbi:MAG: metallophosphoesterase [Desulfobulbaceae bacterium]|nr:metallophosphoesterase [Desulfobulbaceae bacterium]